MTTLCICLSSLSKRLLRRKQSLIACVDYNLPETLQLQANALIMLEALLLYARVERFTYDLSYKFGTA